MLLEVACRRLAGQMWKEIAAAMGWNSEQAASQWAYWQLARIEAQPLDTAAMGATINETGQPAPQQGAKP
jgi:hypothetical protein